MARGTVTARCRRRALPELPEVEITRRHLEAAMVGRVMSDVSIRHQRTSRHNASPDEVEALLTGRLVRSVGRHGKFLLIGLDDEHTLVGHLGMSGRFSVVDHDAETEPHTHFVARLDDGHEVRFVDPRTFGFIAVFDEDELGRSGVGRLGPDAFDSPPSANDLAERLKGRSAPIKALLLDQGPVSGLGNIYADEALFGAGIHPISEGGELGVSEIAALLDSVRTVLGRAIENGGTTLDDLAYLLPDGRAGDNMTVLSVYGRTGEPCVDCGRPIERIIIRGRSTHFCPICQQR
ncbi:MAG: bifunctional DNA-formamidopyrimidine glycosylase/DNA-(apurinic or apyrimidinic site) lyase [Actinomycetota bacterium]|nr:bifunctional DNA-formamidopyrimidine glycosylase/DNA-(apurinic or apyrimidinic site) lyase [Actinomycetota bacterium]